MISNYAKCISLKLTVVDTIRTKIVQDKPSIYNPKDEATGLLKVITDYANSWILLQQYDKNQLEEPKKKHKPKYIINYEKALEEIYKIESSFTKVAA